MGLLVLKTISKSYNGNFALKDINFSLNSGNILCILGPSGCGKTTLLRIIAGLERPDAGSVLFNNKRMNHIPPNRREFRMMFQDFGLFPHMNVFQNVAFGLQIQKLSEEKITDRVNEMLELVDLAGFEDRNVEELSGGERQRVALARSLAPKPLLLLLDEPLGAIDRALRKRLILDLNRILRKVGVTTIMVTHDQSEAFAVADKVGVMMEGQIEQLSSPELIYKNPKTPSVARFLGFNNIFECRVDADGSIQTPVGAYENHDQILYNSKQKITLLIKQDAARILRDGALDSKNEILIKGEVTDRIFQGEYYQVGIQLDNDISLILHIFDESAPPKPGQKIKLGLKKSAIAIIGN